MFIEHNTLLKSIAIFVSTIEAHWYDDDLNLLTFCCTTFPSQPT